MTTSATGAQIRPGRVVMLLWALIVQTVWAHGASARVVALPVDAEAGIEIAGRQIEPCHSWPVSRHIHIYKALTGGDPGGGGSSAKFHEVGLGCDGAIVGVRRAQCECVGRVLTAWRGAHGAGQFVPTGGTGATPGAGDTASARESTRQETDHDETVPSPEDTSKDEVPLIFQYSVSHHRNHDEISLVFREDVVDLVTNTSTYQPDPVRLGWLRNPMNTHFTLLRDRLRIYHAMFGNTVSVLELLLNDPDFAPYAHLLAPEVVPHAPVLRLNDEEIAHDDAYFEGLVTIFDEIWEEEWSCVDCATYRAVGDVIVRTRTREGGERSELEVPASRVDCISAGHGGSRIECVDPEFGIFDIPAGDTN